MGASLSKESFEVDEDELPLRHELAVWVGGGLAGWLVVDAILHRWLQSFGFYRKLGGNQQIRFKSYASSGLNALLMTGFSLYKLMASSSTWRDRMSPSASMKFVAIFLGEMLHDTIITWPVIKDKPAEMWHHGAGITMLVALLYSRAASTVYHKAFIAELSTVFLDAMWLLKETGHGKSMLVRWCKILFAASFGLTRVAWLPFVFYYAIKHDRMANHLFQNYFAFKVTAVGIVALQYYWFVQIMRGLVGMLRKGTL